MAGSVFGAFLAAAEKLKGVAVIQQSVNPATGIAISGHHLETPFAAFGVAAKSLSLLTTIASQALEFKSIAAGNRGIVNKFFKCVTSVSLNAASIAASGMLMAGLLDAGMAIGVGFILASILGCVFEGAKYGAYDYMDRHLP